MTMFGGFSLGRWLGFEIRIDYSWFLVFFLVVWTFSASEFPRQVPGLSEAAYYTMGTGAALLLFLSVLLHELSHSVVARARGLEVEGITLFIFGGVARTRMEAKTAADEFLLTAAGPLSSLALGGIFYVLAAASSAVGLPGPVTLVAQTLAFVNVALAVFNMIPGFPLDGGRIFRSTVWWLTGDLGRATRWATRGGQAFGWFLIGVGALSLWNGYTLNGLWAGFIGWFLTSAASSSWEQFRVRRLLAGVPVVRAMDPEPPTLRAETLVAEAASAYFLRRPHAAYPVVRDGRVLGVLDVEAAAAVPPERRGQVTVADVMTPVADLPTAGTEATLDEVLSLLSGSDDDRALVVEDGRLIGVITLGQISGWLDRAQALGDVQDGPEGARGEAPVGGPSPDRSGGPSDRPGREAPRRGEGRYGEEDR